jgi:16S rRNA C967 or C1407 C5-methylase (RsmB/RsmF family)/NOL1/NOP2/fmu family ribosome biogenesis protein
MINGSFRKYLEEAIGSDNALVAFSAFESPAPSSIRCNPFKSGICPEGRPVTWNAYGRILPERPVFTLDPHFHAGAYYVQDSSSMFVGHAFRRLLESAGKPVGRPFRVLDLCAAPGGKTTDLAASLREVFGDGFILVSNEVMKARAGVLADNVALWGDPNVVVTSDDPRAFAALPGFFDVIVADVPCSGEGMFRKDEEAQRQWSEDNVALCEARQRRITADVWPSLRQDGLFIYSTCTFNKYENDSNVQWIASELGAECLLKEDVLHAGEGVIKTELGYSLVPGHVEGEGQYCSALRKISEVEFRETRQKAARPSKTQTLPEGIVAGLLRVKAVVRLKGETVIAVPENISSDLALIEQALHVIAAGCAVGTLKGKVLVPDADLALSLMYDRTAFPEAEVDRDTALAYLHRDAITLPDAPKGYVAVVYGGLPLGFVKNLGNRCNSLHPQSRRIRMNIK